jgi:hypothetical protein
VIKDNGYTVTGWAGIRRIDVKWKGTYAEIQVTPDVGATQAFDAIGLADHIEGLNEALALAQAMDITNKDDGA